MVPDYSRAVSFIAVLAALWVSLTAAFAAGTPRYALVIGNSSYSRFDPLPNPVRDASDFGGILAELGYRVTYALDADLPETMSIIRKFADKSQGPEPVIFYYSGHAVQMKGTNRLVPVDALMSDRNAAFSETVDLNAVFRILQKSPRPVIAILDASRSNILPDAVREMSGGPGLAELENGRDSFVAFAASPGKTATKADGRNSPFTTALLKAMRSPGRDVAAILEDVRRDVYQETAKKQMPWYVSSLEQPFVFAATAPLPPASSAAPDLAVGGDAAILGGDAAVAAPEAKSTDASATGASASTESATSEQPAATVTDIETAKAKQQAQRLRDINIASRKADKSLADRRRAEALAKRKTDAEARRQAAQQARQKASANSAKPVGKVKTGNRPGAMAYSLSIWSSGLMPHGVSSRKTPYGTLVCKVHFSGWEGTENRSCHWQ